MSFDGIGKCTWLLHRTCNLALTLLHLPLPVDLRKDHRDGKPKLDGGAAVMEEKGARRRR